MTIPITKPSFDDKELASVTSVDLTYLIENIKKEVS